MDTAGKQSIKMKVFPKGQVVIPVSLRKKYRIDVGDQVDVVPKSNGILIKPLPKQNRPRSLTEQLYGVFNAYASGKSKPAKADIGRATEAGFIEGWNK